MKIGSETKIICVILLLVVSFAAWAGPHIYGDSVSYYLMIGSLAKDGDLILDKRDADRWNKERFEAVPVGVYLRLDSEDNLRYAKPVLYPIIAAPFFLILGRFGLAILNGLLLGLCVVFSFLALRRYLALLDSFLIACGFFIFSFVPAYISWVTPDIFLFFSCSLCVFLLTRNKPIACALIIGATAGAKTAFLIMLIPLMAFVISKKEFNRLPKVLAGCFAGLAFVSFLSLYFLKTAFAYSDPQYILFSGAIPHSLEELRSRLVLAPPELIDMRFNSWQLFRANIFNFFTGRFSGMLWYGFPAVVCGSVYFWRRNKIPGEERIQNDLFLVAAILLAGGLLFFRPFNYFGGKGFFGNRYFFIYPALLFPAVFKTLRKPLLILSLFLPAALVSFQVMADSYNMKNWYKSSWARSRVFGFGAHTCTPPLEYAALEINAIENLPVYSLLFSKDLVLYAPRGLKPGLEGRIILEKGQEAVFVLNDNRATLELKTSSGELLLSPVLVLADKSGRERKSFFYFKPDKELELTGVSFKGI